MKFTKLSLVAALAVSSAFAGGDIAPVEPVVAPVVETSATTISGKLTGYYISFDGYGDSMFGDQSQLAFGATLDVSHKFTDWLTANFSALGYVNTMNDDEMFFFEQDGKAGGYFNVANLTGTFGDTTVVLGRQLLGTPMIQGYDWLLAPGSFEAYTVMNNSIENVTLVGAYVTKWRPNNTGEFGNGMDSLDGDNWTVGAAYDDKTISGSVWYYNVDAMGYSQVYVDLGYDFGSFKVAGQYVDTEDDFFGDDGTAYGLMASTSVAGFDLSAAYNNLEGYTGFVGWNGLYTNQWNTTVASEVPFGESIDAFKVAASTTIMDVSTEISYSDFDNDGHEFNLILGYDVTDAIDVGLVYADSDNFFMGDASQIELYANYKF